MSSEDIERRKRLELAVEGDDWSGVIDGQTRLTEEPKVGEVEVPTVTIIRCVVFVCPTTLHQWTATCVTGLLCSCRSPRLVRCRSLL